MDAEDWLYGDGEHEAAGAYRRKLAELRVTGMPMAKRAAELAARPKVGGGGGGGGGGAPAARGGPGARRRPRPQPQAYAQPQPQPRARPWPDAPPSWDLWGPREPPGGWGWPGDAWDMPGPAFGLW
jgi:hypothetical protein